MGRRRSAAEVNEWMKMGVDEMCAHTHTHTGTGGAVVSQ